MSRTRWHIVSTSDSYTLARHWPPRLDVSAQTRMPPAQPDRLARQVRQDLWRLLQGLRGFSPVVTIEREASGWGVLVAGGRVLRPVPDDIPHRIQALLDSDAHRRRWLHWAGAQAS